VGNSGFMEDSANGFKPELFVERNHGDLGVEKDLFRSGVSCRRGCPVQKLLSDPFSPKGLQYRHAADFCPVIAEDYTRRTDRLIADQSEKMQSIPIRIVDFNFFRHSLLANENTQPDTERN
jgi:hypothetical protein